MHAWQAGDFTLFSSLNPSDSTMNGTGSASTLLQSKAVLNPGTDDQLVSPCFLQFAPFESSQRPCSDTCVDTVLLVLVIVLFIYTVCLTCPGYSFAHLYCLFDLSWL